MVNGSFTYTTGTTPSVRVDFGTYSGGTFSPFNPAIYRDATVVVVNPPSGTFSISPGYQGTAGVQVAFKSTLYTMNFFGVKSPVADSVGTITP